MDPQFFIADYFQISGYCFSGSFFASVEAELSGQKPRGSVKTQVREQVRAQVPERFGPEHSVAVSDPPFRA